MVAFRKFLLIFSAIILLLIAVLNFFAFRYFWYWYIWWFDNLMHFLGGLALGLFGCWLFFSAWRRADVLSIPVTARTILPMVFLASLAIGSIWELFEFSLDQLLGPQIHFKTLRFLGENSRDVLTDTVFDLIGGLLVGLFIIWLWNVKKSKFISMEEQSR